MCLPIKAMAYIRNKKIKGKTYFYLVEGKKDKNGKVKQKVIRYLGNPQHILEVFSFWNKNK